MRRVSNGYTIIEVMVFLVISAALLASAIVVIGGRDAHVQFSQSMRDIESKMQDWINDVSTGFTGTTAAQYSCTLDGTDMPQINNRSVSSPPSEPECIFLGRAIQFTDASYSVPEQSSKVYVYSVFGRREVSSNQLVDNMIDANPIAATGSSTGSGNADITETYTLNGGAKVLSVTSTGGSLPNNHMIGFFSSFNTEQSVSQNGSQSLKAYQYRLNLSAAPGNNQPGGASVRNCIKLAVGLCGPGSVNKYQWPEPLQKLAICFGNDRNSDQALLTINSSNGQGATTQLEFKDCG